MGKFLDKSGVEKLWSKTKGHVATEIGKIDVSGDIAEAIKNNVTDKLGAASGIATLGSDSKLTASQLPALKTVNGESIVGSGNIAIDLNIYQIVDSLPESNQNPNKIYLVLTSPATGQEQDTYTEYLWTGTKWEKLGEYKADIDLAPYLKIENLKEEGKKAGLVTFDDVVTKNKNGVLSKEEYEPLSYIVQPGKSMNNNALGYEGETVKPYAIKQLHFAQDSEFYDEKAYSDGKLVLIIENIGKSTSEYALIDNQISSIEVPKATSTKNGVMSHTDFNKLSAIAAEATKDEAITSEELDAILV